MSKHNSGIKYLMHTLASGAVPTRATPHPLNTRDLSHKDGHAPAPDAPYFEHHPCKPAVRFHIQGMLIKACNDFNHGDLPLALDKVKFVAELLKHAVNESKADEAGVVKP